MQKLWLENKINYDGEQLKPLTNYLKHGLLGNSIVGWRGECAVTPEHMIDGEDLRESCLIAGKDMLHFVLELFDFDLRGAIFLQRLMAEMAKSILIDLSKKMEATKIVRDGDDLFFEKRKLNISIATCSSNSSLIHFGINVSNEGTPVPTCALSEFAVEPKAFAQKFLDEVTREIEDTLRASFKVRVF